jgi:hypothetical protein
MLDKKILLELEAYIQEHFFLELALCKSSDIFEESISESILHIELDDYITNKRKPTLQDVLFGFIDKKEVSDSYIYKKAGIDRKHFSKIRTTPDYRPRKNTIIALAFALELNEVDTDYLLSSAGYALSDSDKSDLVIKFCLERKIYDLFQVNEALDYFSLKPLN